MNQNTSIGEKIKALRTSQNLTLKQLGEMTNLSTGFLSQMERGLSSIAIDTLETIAGVLGVSLGSFSARNRTQTVRIRWSTAFPCPPHLWALRLFRIPLATM